MLTDKEFYPMPTHPLHRQRIDAKQQRSTKRLADTACRVRQGEVTAVNPLEVELAGSGVSSEMVALQGQRLAVGDRVEVLRWGKTGVVLGKVNADPVGAAAGTLDVSTTGNKTVSGLGFRPSIVRFTPNFTNSASISSSATGRMTDGFQSAQAAFHSGAGTARRTETNRCYISLDSNGLVAAEAARVSLNADGFTINVIGTSGAVPSVTWEAHA